ncbi:MAG: hypothetical protein WBZ36_28260 [Candidatus Nitrosopolaris sp.]
MSKSFLVLSSNSRTENIYERWRCESYKKLFDKHSKKDGETLERFYNRINLDEIRRKMLDDSKEKNHVSGQLVENKK